MREYLDKQKLLMALNDKYHDMSGMPASYYAGFQYAMRLIEIATPEKDVTPVARAKWEYDKEESQKHIEPLYRCTNCGVRVWGAYEMTDFCGGCGAKMDLEEDK